MTGTLRTGHKPLCLGPSYLQTVTEQRVGTQGVHVLSSFLKYFVFNISPFLNIVRNHKKFSIGRVNVCG